MTKTIRIYDAQQQAELTIALKRGQDLAAKYPSRFKIIFNSEKENYTMPAMPTEKKALPNGAHTLIALEVETTHGMYGAQEEITCCVEGQEETLTRVWVTHKSLQQVKAAAAAGLVRINEDDNSWEVTIGARFVCFVAGGKVVGVAAPAPAAPPVAKQ